MRARTEHVCTLGKDEKLQVIELLVGAGISGDDLRRAMNSRVCDLEDTVDVSRIGRCAGE